VSSQNLQPARNASDVTGGRERRKVFRIPGRYAAPSLEMREAVGADCLNQPVSLRTICCGIIRSKRSDRHILRIHGQTDLSVSPPFVRPTP